MRTDPASSASFQGCPRQDRRNWLTWDSFLYQEERPRDRKNLFCWSGRTDGKEVYALPPDVSDVRKYYVIRRVEEVGRLFLDRGDGYPELIEVLRKPKEVRG